MNKEMKTKERKKGRTTTKTTSTVSTLGKSRDCHKLALTFTDNCDNNTTTDESYQEQTNCPAVAEKQPIVL